ncbi:MAG: hypothetical protein GTN64_05540 [Candidatus Latescibacteria bacterium]|nr:hypothetical protein [Candidatus Latescibacterota bacterium]NIO78072.1 hypothetical protein [Candidatus Latescibacterota bacterium]
MDEITREMTLYKKGEETNCPVCSTLGCVPIYDHNGIYAGLFCSERCASKRVNLNYDDETLSEFGERVDDEY